MLCDFCLWGNPERELIHALRRVRDQNSEFYSRNHESELQYVTEFMPLLGYWRTPFSAAVIICFSSKHFLCMD
jgi:hypothetical protein